MLYYDDSYVDMDDYKYIIQKYVNTNNYVSVDPNYLTQVNYFVRKNEITNASNEDETFTSATIEKTSTDFEAADKKTLIQFNLRLDNYQISTEITRADWFNSIGTVGGIQGFYAMIIFFFLDHFTGIDYLTTVIKSLFLEK